MNFLVLSAVAGVIGLRGLLKLYWGAIEREPDNDLLRPIQYQVGGARAGARLALFVLGTAEIVAACAALMWGLR